MKKLLVLATVMVTLFGFSTGALAVWGDPICENCPVKDKVGCFLERIPCTFTETQGATATCPGFEFDSFPGQAVRYGYCPTPVATNCKALFNICNCEDPSLFDSGETIGIRMTVLVDGVAGQLGAYWADPLVTDIDMYTYGTADVPCEDSGTFGSFDAIEYWKADKITPATPLAGTSCASVPAKNQAVVLYSATPTTGYTIGTADVTEKRHTWWIDIPGMRIDRNVLNDGELISVKIELLGAGTGGICADCDAICECIIDVAIVCCATDPYTQSMYFPYVLPGDEQWQTGIVVTNLGSGKVPPADMVATFTLTDSAGAVFTYEKSDFETVVWAGWLNDILPEFDGTPAVGKGWLRVDANFYLDGYQFLTDGVWGAGTLPRSCSN